MFVTYRLLTREAGQMFRKANDKEIQSWLNTETVCKILRHQVPIENAPPMDPNLEANG